MMASFEQFRASVAADAPEEGLSVPLTALWWDAKGDWARAHALVDALETTDGMTVHAYLHRKEGVAWNAEYWYKRAGKGFHRGTLEEEWAALAEGLLGRA
jgi:chitodextrinase